MDDNMRIGIDAVKLAKSETEGFFIKDFPGHVATVRTKNSIYKFTIDENLDIIGVSTDLDGNPPRKYLKNPEKVHICGSTWGGSMLKMGYIGIDMYIEFWDETHRDPEKGPVLTSAVQSIKLEKIKT